MSRIKQNKKTFSPAKKQERTSCFKNRTAFSTSCKKSSTKRATNELGAKARSGM